MKQGVSKYFAEFHQVLLCRTGAYAYVVLFIAILMVSQLSLYPVSAYAAEDDYLKQLDQEAQSSATFNKGSSKKDSANNSQRDKKRAKEFEHLLKFERPSTYTFYQKLNLTSRKKVIQTFYKQQDLSIASKKIFDLYFEQNK